MRSRRTCHISQAIIHTQTNERTHGFIVYIGQKTISFKVKYRNHLSIHVLYFSSTYSTLLDVRCAKLFVNWCGVKYSKLISLLACAQYILLWHDATHGTLHTFIALSVRSKWWRQSTKRGHARNIRNDDASGPKAKTDRAHNRQSARKTEKLLAKRAGNIQIRLYSGLVLRWPRRTPDLVLIVRGHIFNTFLFRVDDVDLSANVERIWYTPTTWCLRWYTHPPKNSPVFCPLAWLRGWVNTHNYYMHYWNMPDKTLDTNA